MERRRRAYKNLKIEDALEAKGIKPSDMLPPEKSQSLLSYQEKYDLYSKASYLPLEVFDDEEYDCRTVEEWINLGIVDGVRYPLPATIFVEKAIQKNRMFDRNDKTLNDLFGWTQAAVMDYNSEEKVWTVLTLDGLKRKFLLPRIYIRFHGEDPRKFVQRVANAVKRRQIAEAAIRYHFYLDCMRIDCMPAFDEERQKGRIILLVSQQVSIERVPDHLSSLMEEITLEYRRVMCNLMWRSLVEKQPDTFNFIAWEKINDVHDVIVPEVGKVHTGMEDFAKTKNYFHHTILYVLPEVHEAMQCVVVECIHVSDMKLFVSNYGKSMSLLEFESQQNLETGMVMKYLKESWLERIAQSVRMCLRDLENGWLDPELKNHEIYDVMKLKRFMDVAVLRMQTALRNLVYKSIALYVEMLIAPAKCALNVNEDFVWGTDLINTQFKSSAHPVFNIDILMNDETVYYSSDLQSFEEVIINLLDDSLSQCHQVKQLHSFLLPSLEFLQDLFLSSVGLMEKQVCEARDRLRVAYGKSIIPLKAYANEYRQYLDFFTLNVDKYMKDFKDADHTTVEVKDEISFHLKMKSALENALPNEIIIGPFRVNVQLLKNLLVQKRQYCSTQLLTMFTESLSARIDTVLTDYSQIIARLRSPSRDIEHLFEEQDWVLTIPLMIKPLDETVLKLTREFDVLDYFWRNLSDQDFEAKWQAIGSSRQVRLLMEDATKRFAGEYEKFYKLQVQDEIILSEKINILIENVATMTLQADINRIDETAIEMKRIEQTIKEYRNSGLLLNKRQELFRIKVVVYHQLDELIEKFEPYLMLWVTASDWLKWQEMWMGNPLVNIDAHKIEGIVADLHKTISRCAEILQDNPNVVTVALTMKNQIEAFKLYIGVIQALREPKMKAHHFEELLKKTGVQMTLTPTLTLKHLLILGVMEFEDIVMAVANAARTDTV
ncbi:dynein heavy chain 1, axonemal [Odontomachus brunneus]|uniref:dynein heavy chain 1, axonemal n=1 Tax=Odontomachus brunneus TaxID=486640 RepID=UPI0013F1C169|nr:dynein heavy chain 1, axonemal [Odontomachus brunneus]